MSTEKFTIFFVLRGYVDGNHEHPTDSIDGWYWQVPDEPAVGNRIPCTTRRGAEDQAKDELGPWTHGLSTDPTDEIIEIKYGDEAWKEDYSDYNLVTVERVSQGLWRIRLEGSYETLDLTISSATLQKALESYRACLAVVEW